MSTTERFFVSITFAFILILYFHFLIYKIEANGMTKTLYMQYIFYLKTVRVYISTSMLKNIRSISPVGLYKQGIPYSNSSEGQETDLIVLPRVVHSFDD